MREDERRAFLDVFAAHQGRIHFEDPLAPGGCGYLGKNVERFGEVHGRSGTRMLVVMPGRKFFVGPRSWARTSMVPLEGSMTGLISTTLAVNLSSPLSGEVTSRDCPRWILPAKRSGKVNFTRRGEVSVTQNMRSPRLTSSPARM